MARESSSGVATSVSELLYPCYFTLHVVFITTNKWRWFVWMVAAYIGGLTGQVGWLGLRVGAQSAFIK